MLPSIPPENACADRIEGPRRHMLSRRKMSLNVLHAQIAEGAGWRLH
jgi:hypothetical protein